MKLTKGMKKALSLLLTSALVITGANFTSSNASAADTTLSFRNTPVANFAGNGTYTASEDIVTASANIVDGNLGFFESNIEFTLRDVSVSVNGTEIHTVASIASAAKKDADGNLTGMYGVDFVNTWDINDKTRDGEVIWEKDNTAIKYHNDGTSSGDNNWGSGSMVYYVDGAATDVTSYEVSFTFDDGTGVVPSAEPTEPASGSATKEPDVMPEKGDMNEFGVDLWYVSDGWSEQIGEGNAISITGDGEYSVSLTALQDSADIFMLILTTNLFNGSTAEDFKITATKLSVGSTEYNLDTADGYWCFSDNTITNAFRYNVRNEYNYLVEDDLLTDTETKADSIGEDVTVPVEAGDEIKVTFTVAGMDPNAPTKTYEAPKEETTAPTTTPTTTPSTKPSVSATPSATTPAAVTSGTAATKKITVAKKSVVIAAGKSATVKFNTTKTAAASKAAAVKVSTGNKKVATVKKVSGKKQVKISVPKKATKGATTKITIKSGSKKATIKVSVQNKAKKVKAAKKKITVKKGKTAKVTFKVTATNKKKAVADTIKTSVKKKVAKVTKTTIKKGKVILTVKGLKKGKSGALTIKVGKKSAKTTIKVK